MANRHSGVVCAGGWDVPAVVGTSAVLLAISLLLPAVRVEAAMYWQDSFSLLQGMVVYWEMQMPVRAAVLFFVFALMPFAKLALVLVLWMLCVTSFSLRRAPQALHTVGQWAAVELFLVVLAVTLIMVDIGPAIAPRAGLHLFAVAICASTLATMYVSRTAEHHLRRQCC